MNISTYEARIAALEAQQGPGPSDEGGILSVTVTPDINLSLGGTLNSWLSDNLPLADGKISQLLSSQDALINDQMYEVSATPGGNWRMNVSGSGFGQPGVSMTGSATVTNSALRINIISGSDPQDHTAPHAQIQLTISGGE